MASTTSSSSGTTSSGAGRHIPMGGIKFGELTKFDAPRVSDQAQRFVLVNYLLHRAGMCGPDIRACLTRYISTLPGGKLSQLKLHFPHVNTKLWDASFVIPETLEGLATLGDPCVLTSTALADLLRAAMVHFINSPSWAYGVDGWLLWTASHASRIPVKGVPVSTGFWLGELENAIWTATLSRAIVLKHADKTPIPLLTRQALREGLYMLFNFTADTAHFEKSCVCPDKFWTYEHPSFPSDIYTEDVVPLAGAADDDELARRKTAIKRIEVNFVETCDRLVFPAMDAEAEAKRRGARPAKDQSFSAATISTLYTGKQRPFSSQIVDAHWAIAAPLLETGEQGAEHFAGKLKRGCHVMAFGQVAAKPAVQAAAPVAAKVGKGNAFAVLGEDSE